MYIKTQDRKKSTVGYLVGGLFAVAASILLPQLFHAVGQISGLKASLGAALLPMQIPVLLAGFLLGPAVGLLVGAISPLVSFSLSGMPNAALLPLILVELAVYGGLAGLVAKTKWNEYTKLLVVQVCGRVARMGAFLISARLFQTSEITFWTLCSFVMAGLWGILLQLLIIPPICRSATGGAMKR